MPDSSESSQDLIVHHGTSGWLVALYPSTRLYKRVCYTEASLRIVICSELDGRHVHAVKNGRVLWRKDSYTDWGLLPYRTPYPAVCLMKEWSSSGLPPFKDFPHAIIVTYDSSQFGAVEVETGKFRMLGQN